MAALTLGGLTGPAATPASLLATLRKGHPRILASPGTFNDLQKRIAGDATMLAWRQKLTADARKLLTAPPSKYEIPDGLRLLSTSRRVVSRVYTLALLHHLEGDPAYAKRAWDELETAAAFPDWNPRHFLDTAEMTHAFAIGYDWLHEVWTPGQRERLHTAMVEKGFQPALKIYRAANGWSKVKHNWNQVCNGGIGTGALALAEVEPGMAEEIVEAAVKSIHLPMAEFAPDGAWKEGPGYWDYATAYNVLFLAALETALGTDFGLSNLEAFDRTGLFPLYFTGPTGRTFNYADAHDNAVRSPQRFWLSRRFHQPVAAWCQQRAAQPTAQDLLWYDAQAQSPREADLPLDNYYRGAEVVLMRSEWENPAALFAGFKAGDNQANHSHLDLGGFVFDALGERWALDLGSDDYNLPGYFGKQRWTYYRLRAEGHNTLVINPGTGPDQVPSAKTAISRFQTGAGGPLAVADLTPAYAPHALKVWRGIQLRDRRELLVQDEVETAAPARVWWFMHTTAAVTFDEPRRVATLEQGGRQLRVEILSPDEARWDSLEPRPLPGCPAPEKQADNHGVRKLALALADLSQARITVRLTPVSPGVAAPPPPGLKALADW